MDVELVDVAATEPCEGDGCDRPQTPLGALLGAPYCCRACRPTRHWRTEPHAPGCEERTATRAAGAQHVDRVHVTTGTEE